MKMWSDSFKDQSAIPVQYAFCAPDSQSHCILGANKNPHFAWDEVPEATKSFVLICHDPDVPSRGDDVNQEGRTIAASLPRVDFYHWLLADINASMRVINAGEYSNQVTAHGKPGPQSLHGTLQGINDYTGWFASNSDMAGQYFGYDGPCPPWNDTIVHHYVFTLYALDLAQVRVVSPFNGAALRAALEGHILATAKCTALYSLNPEVRF